ncbi:PQQ-dependent sugar dehydrogenase [Natrarchaeobaculum sulfurireducens]|uniref:Glucose/sorbosone dehydrogenase n=1 Tax=Natrarchaeobaculum sulfurireducens TaxID=2044521 RepID=A0A346PLU5_9EURY|nr:PQQ-dependent sugar dehydrogenase [Natrarchaeobaculum sulfurireducens]AXR76821.1 Glucose/sorbosone dehydrogenase [Natrarchaeobaculum sulfurireducens]AXR80490.1 PQQ-dependent oxidoreductase, gdhB family [Natrarchaeobaculum sulfurireducens]
MNRRTYLSATAALGLSTLSGCAGVLSGGDDPFETETVVDGLEHPWGMAFLPDDEHLLVTERPGRLALVDRETGDLEDVSGTPGVADGGQGGLLDVAIHPEFDDDPWLYLTYAIGTDDGGSTTALGRTRLDVDEAALADGEELYVVEPSVDSTAHYGSRVVFDDDGLLYATVGDRGSKDFGEDHYSQDLTTEIGTTLRLEDDGSIPEDNPFVDGEGPAGEDALEAIYSYGHRNAQGMTVHPETGNLWQSEHGEEDGDELNVVEAGGNYGWPIAHTGCEYGTDDLVGDDPFERDDVVDPVYYWECTTGGFPPGGMAFYDGDAFTEWEGDLLVGTLAGEYLGRFTVDGTDVEESDRLLEGRGWRIRDVAVAPDTGYPYVAVDDADAPIVRLLPE